jgi:hypothetical protein
VRQHLPPLSVLDAVDETPRSASAIYLAMNGLPPDTHFTVSHRSARRHVGRSLERLAREGLVVRHVERIGGRAHITFSTLTTSHA